MYRYLPLMSMKAKRKLGMILIIDHVVFSQKWLLVCARGTSSLWTYRYFSEVLRVKAMQGLTAV